MSTVKKLTKRDHYATLLTLDEVKANPVLVEFIEHEVELLAKKNASSTSKPTATQIANDGFKTAIMEYMVDGEKYTVTDLLKAVPALADLTNQRVSALVRQLVEAKIVVRIEDKRKAYFAKA